MDNQTTKDIAETLGNEAVLLEALEHVYDAVVDTCKKLNGGAKDLRTCTDAFSHIRDICALAIQSCQAPEPWTEAPDKVTEYNENRLSNMIIGMGLNKVV